MLLKDQTEAEDPSLDSPTFCGKNTNLIYQSPKSILPSKKPSRKKAAADPEAVRSEGWTPLHVACANGHLEVLRQLLEVQFFGGNFLCPNVTEMTIQKRDMVFGARIPPSSTWGYQTILHFYPETGGK